MGGKFTKKEIAAIVLAFVVLFCIVSPFYYNKYREKTSCDLTYLSYRSVKDELNECVDFFTSKCREEIDKYGSDAEFTLYPSHYNEKTDKYEQYTLRVEYSDSENNYNSAELQPIDDSTGKIWDNIKKLQTALNGNGYNLGWFSRQKDVVGFENIRICRNEFNFCFFSDYTGLKGVAYSLDGHIPKYFSNNAGDKIQYRFIAKNWYKFRAKR